VAAVVVDVAADLVVPEALEEAAEQAQASVTT